jgi:CBS-domain-containing membrane protein
MGPGLNLTFRQTALRLLWCVVGAASGIGATLALAGPSASPVFLASLGGSAVFLFGLTRAPAAQPRALFGGHIGGAMIGIACYQCFGDALWVYVLAQAITLAYMLLARTVHPPAGANPLIMVHGHAAFAALWQPVLVGVCTLAIIAFVWSRVGRGQVRYPCAWLAESPPTVLWGAWDD